jgi:hypothetical protein
MNDSERDSKEHGGHVTTIIVNGRKKEVKGNRISFEEVVTLSGLPGGENILFTVTYTHADEHRPDGTLVAGGSVKIKDKTTFNVTTTNKS